MEFIVGAAGSGNIRADIRTVFRTADPAGYSACRSRHAGKNHNRKIGSLAWIQPGSVVRLDCCSRRSGCVQMEKRRS